MINVIDYKHWYLGVSIVLVVAGIVAIGAFGFRQGIDFTGGTLWQFQVANKAPAVDDVSTFFSDSLGIKDAHVTFSSQGNVYFVRSGVVSEQDHQSGSAKLKAAFPDFVELSFSSIGPSISAELKKNALWAIVLVLCGISAYIAFAFRRVSYPVSSWTYGFITLVTLFHDVVVPAGLLAALGKWAGVEIDTNFIVALLVVMGFSVHDTIVVFDRIRENLIIAKDKTSFSSIINASVNQTLARSFNTSLTLIFVLIALLLLGPANLRYFVLTLLVGVSTGIYSSVFMASPLLSIVAKNTRK